MAGRKFLLTENIVQETKGMFSTGISKSSGFKVLASRLGVHSQTVYGYYRAGRALAEFTQQDPSARLNKKERTLLAFFEAVEYSPAHGELTLAQTVFNQAIGGNEKLLVFLLERRWPQTWSKSKAKELPADEENRTEKPGALFVQALDMLTNSPPINISSLPVIDPSGNLTQAKELELKQKLEKEVLNREDMEDEEEF